MSKYHIYSKYSDKQAQANGVNQDQTAPEQFYPALSLYVIQAVEP